MERVADSYWNYIHPEPNTGCWLWSGAANRMGYGHLWVDGVQVQAYRFVYERERAAIPEGLYLDHLCRNHYCVNPDHLEPVTPQENSRRSPIIGRRGHAWRVTHCKRGHAYEGENVYFTPSGSRRQCRACQAIRDARKRAKNITPRIGRGDGEASI